MCGGEIYGGTRRVGGPPELFSITPRNSTSQVVGHPGRAAVAPRSRSGRIAGGYLISICSRSEEMVWRGGGASTHREGAKGQVR